MQNPKYTVRHNFDDPTTELVFNNTGISGRGTEFPKRIYSQTSFEIQLELFKWDNIDDKTELAYDLTGFTSASVKIKPAGTTITATSIGTGVAIGPPTDGKLLFTVDSDLIPDNLASYTSRANPTPITLYLIIEDSTNDNKISLETRIEVMDIDRDGTENNSALDAGGINFNAEQTAKWTARYNDVPVTLENALNKLGRDQPTDQGVVINQLAAQPASPTDGDRYLATATADDWTVNYIHEWNDAAVAWLDYTPKEGDEVYDATLTSRLRFESSAWAAISVEDGAIITDKLADGSITQAKLDAGFTLPDDNVTNTQLANMQSNTIKGRLTAGAGDPQDLTSSQVKQILGLDAVDNTTDADKPISTLQQAALDLKLDATAQAADSAKYGGYTIDDTNISNARVLAMKSGLTEFEFVDQSGGGGSGGFDFPYLFSTDTAATDPTSGGIKFNNATPASVTEIYVSSTDNDSMLINTLINSLGSGDQLVLKQSDTPANRLRFNVTSVTDNTTYITITGTVADSGFLPSNGSSCGIGFEYVTGGGASGVSSVNGQTGAVTTAQNTNDLTNRSNVTGATTSDALNTLDTGKAESSITISATGGITSSAADLTSASIDLDLDVDSLPSEATPASGDQLIIFDGTQNKKVDWNLLPGAGGGEVNTISSVGGDTSLVSGKVGADLQIKSINFGTNLSVSGVTSTGFTLAAATGTLDTTQVNGWSGQQYFDSTTLTFSSNISWNLNLNQVTEITLTGNATLNNPSNIRNGSTYILHVVQDSSGAHTLVFGTNYKFVGDAVPVITSNANHRDIFTFSAIGGKLYGTYVQGFTS